MQQVMGPQTTVTSLGALDKFDGKNYHLWSAWVKMFFIANDLWDVVIPNPKYKTRGEDKDYMRRSTKALAYIALSLTDSIFLSSGIAQIETASEAWRKLEATFAGRSLVSRVFLEQSSPACTWMKVWMS